LACETDVGGPAALRKTALAGPQHAWSVAKTADEDYRPL